MKKGNKILMTSLMSVLVMSMNAMPVLAEETTSNEKDIVVLYTNDIHCGVNEEKSMGISGVAAYKAEMAKEYG